MFGRPQLSQGEKQRRPQFTPQTRDTATHALKSARTDSAPAANPNDDNANSETASGTVAASKMGNGNSQMLDNIVQGSNCALPTFLILLWQGFPAAFLGFFRRNSLYGASAGRKEGGNFEII